ncbi:oxidoreductase [Spongiactinospora gelatinilytica]|uniref:oxidoreductase n=1 Tax=Spongiactinospora gelatinilytica TaxID=2666298 RepID=UPI0011B935E5|nr:oxidoreductase [Spongiactinospora gelatinilytica]
MRRSRRFWRLTPAERQVWNAYPTGEWVDFRIGDRERDDPASGDGWGPERTVRAELLVALLLGVRDPEPGRTAGLRLAGARITGSFDLSDATVTAKVHLLNCHLADGVDITDITAHGIRLRGCDISRVRAARATVEGLFELDGSHIHRGVRLDNAHVSGQLRMSHARITAPLRRGHGENDGANKIDVRRPMSESELEERGYTTDVWAVWAGGLTVDGGAFMRGLRASGGLRLIGARFNGGLYLRGAEVTNVRSIAVNGDHLQASAVEFNDGFKAEGTVRLRGARIDGVLSFHGSTVSAPDRIGLHLSHAQVDEVILTPDSLQGTINLGYSRIGVLLDQPDAYDGDVRLNGLVYESLRGDWAVADRLRWLRRSANGYRPQPYEQLAGWYRRIGHEPDARRVLLAKQRERRGTLRLPGRTWGRLLDAMVGYGYRPWLAAVWAALLLFTGMTVFHLIPPAKIDMEEVRHFDPFVYTLDLLVPVSVFEQRGAWEPVGWTLWLANLLIVTGWVLATALIAGATRVLRPVASS